MRLPRRTFLHLAASAAALPAVSRIAWAESYPSRPVRFVVGFAPGVGTTLHMSGELFKAMARIAMLPVSEFIAYAKANSGKVMFASSGALITFSTLSWMSVYPSAGARTTCSVARLLEAPTRHVPYRGLAAGGYADLMTGTVHVTFDNLPPSIELIRAGKLRALAVTSTMRSQAMPELPTVADFLPGYEASAWHGCARRHAACRRAR